MTDIPTPLGNFPSAPAATDNATVILWVVSGLVVALIVSLILLKRKMDQNEEECRAANKLARDEAQQVRAQNERLYQEAIKATAEREKALAEVVERNTAAFNALRDTVGSGYHRALREQQITKPAV